MCPVDDGFPVGEDVLSTPPLIGDDAAEPAPVDPPEHLEGYPPEGTAPIEDPSEAVLADPSQGYAPVDETPVDRRGRGDLAAAVKGVTDEYVSGEWVPADGAAVTPHRIATRLKERDGLDKAPSTGAITNIIRKWGDVGFAVLADSGPLTFLRYAGDGSVEELAAKVAAARPPKPPKPEKAPEDASPEGASPAVGAAV